MKTGRPASRPPQPGDRARPSRVYEPPPPPRRVEWKCEGCGQVNLVWLDDALYSDVTKGIASCAKCGRRLG